MYLTVSRVAKILNCSEGNVRKLERKGVLRAERAENGTRLFPPAEVERVAAERRARQEDEDDD
jgi:excisionase family DNA binding protein